MDETTLQINGRPYQFAADKETPLLTVLRELLDLTGSKYGCGEGQCGACTVLVDGKARRSCMLPVWAAAGKQITTIEGLASSIPSSRRFLRKARCSAPSAPRA